MSYKTPKEDTNVKGIVLVTCIKMGCCVFLSVLIINTSWTGTVLIHVLVRDRSNTKRPMILRVNLNAFLSVRMAIICITMNVKLQACAGRMDYIIRLTKLATNIARRIHIQIIEIKLASLTILQKYGMLLFLISSWLYVSLSYFI